MLVRTARLADEAELRRGHVLRATGALVIVPADDDALRLALTAAARWEKYDARTKKWVAADAPLAVAKALLATAEKWSAIPILTGIVEAPTLRRDGTVLDRPATIPRPDCSSTRAGWSSRACRRGRPGTGRGGAGPDHRDPGRLPVRGRRQPQRRRLRHHHPAREEGLPGGAAARLHRDEDGVRQDAAGDPAGLRHDGARPRDDEPGRRSRPTSASACSRCWSKVRASSSSTTWSAS
jgi:hypothetical protein